MNIIKFKLCERCRGLVPLACFDCCYCSNPMNETEIVYVEKHRFYEQWQDQKEEHWNELELNRRLGK